MFSRNKDKQAMSRLGMMVDSMVNYTGSGIYAEGSRGYTNHLVSNKSDGSTSEELGRRFILEEVDVDSEKLNISDLDKASQDDIKALTNVFDSWLRSAVGDVENNDVFNVQHSARFHDLLVIDEGSLCSLTALPMETPPLGLVSREGGRARIILYCDSYVWLVDPQGVKQVQGGGSDGGEYGHNYDGWMKLCMNDIPEAWFERLRAFRKSVRTFERREMPEGSGKFWYYGP
ncbi:hypothetical protein V496_09401 [Pseudogymnoascus sp. VKM F-4515 (FW-2607)]|nr:hypothetical protein V496_09401 [Pseudogymnoascus sp. VKM F-4515 (FW-2607)]